MRLPVAGDHEKRNGDIKRVGAGIIGRRVGIPHDVIVAAEFPAALVEPAGFLAKTINVFVIAQLFGDAKFAPAREIPRAGSSASKMTSPVFGKGNPKRRILDHDLERRRRKRRGLGTDFGFNLGHSEVTIHHGVGMVAAERGLRGEPDADDIVRKRRDGECPLPV